MKYITGDEWLRVKGYWLMVIGLMLIAGCSSDSSGEQQRSAGSPLQVVPYIAAYQGNDALSRRAVSFALYPQSGHFYRSVRLAGIYRRSVGAL